MSPDDGPVSGGTLAFEVRLLGPVQVIRAGRDVGLGGPRPRAVLALLVLEAGRVVSAGQLIEEIWQGSPSPGAARVRCDRTCHGCGRCWPRTPCWRRGAAADVLDADLSVVDAVRFERLAGAGQAALGHGDPAAAAARFREALGLWRGPALAA